MEAKGLAEEALKSSFKAEVGNLYRVFSNAVTMADNNQDSIDEAINKFNKGYEIAKKVYDEAKGMIS